MLRKKSFLIYLLVILILTTNIFSVYANDNILPSGIKYSELDYYISDYIKTFDYATTGVAMAIINEDETIYKNYYGELDLENNIEVNENSVFEWGSVSKMLTWVSVMQLSEKGLIKLDKDIRRYLPKNFFTKLNYNNKITMLNLMNHNAGWQETTTEAIIEEDGTETRDLLKLLKENEPVQVFEPGEVCSYSNWGSGLAAAIVERVSGMSYSEYVHKNILEPLNMNNTSVLNDYSDNEWVQTQIKYNKGYYPSFNDDDSVIIDEEGNIVFEEQKHYQIALYPAGAAAGTLNDFIKFAKEFTKDEKSVLFKKCKTMDKFLSSTLNYGTTETGRISHGLWTLECKNQIMGHYGNTLVNSSGLVFDTVTNTAYVVMTNQISEQIYNYAMLDMIFGTASQREISTDDFIDANILKDEYVYSRTYYDTDKYIDSSVIDLSVIDSNTVSIAGDIFTQYEPGLFVSDIINWAFYVSKDENGYTKINFYTADLLEYDYVKDIVSNVNFSDFDEYFRNKLKKNNKSILDEITKQKLKCEFNFKK
jgi:CubicO group peptidase (beta-lactamase class C family)